MAFPTFASGDVLNASDMNAVGLWLVKTQTIGTGVSSVTVSNAFSATYDNYKVLINGGVGSTGISLRIQLGTSTTGYYGNLLYSTYAGISPLSDANNNAAHWDWVGYATTNYVSMCVDIINPFATKYTQISAPMWTAATAAGQYSGVHNVATSYADLKILTNTGTLTGGTIRVYGYRN